MNTQKQANPDYPINELIAQRWSPYAFANRPVLTEDLRSVFEAARWAASSYNEQPWSYIVAVKHDEDAFQMLLSCLVEGNQGWASAAPVLAIGCTNLKFTRIGISSASGIEQCCRPISDLMFMERNLRQGSRIDLRGQLLRKANDHCGPFDSVKQSGNHLLKNQHTAISCFSLRKSSHAGISGFVCKPFGSVRTDPRFGTRCLSLQPDF